MSKYIVKKVLVTIILLFVCLAILIPQLNINSYAEKQVKGVVHKEKTIIISNNMFSPEVIVFNTTGDLEHSIRADYIKLARKSFVSWEIDKSGTFEVTLDEWFSKDEKYSNAVLERLYQAIKSKKITKDSILKEPKIASDYLLILDTKHFEWDRSEILLNNAGDRDLNLPIYLNLNDKDKDFAIYTGPHALSKINPTIKIISMVSSQEKIDLILNLYQEDISSIIEFEQVVVRDQECQDCNEGEILEYVRDKFQTTKYSYQYINYREVVAVMELDRGRILVVDTQSSSKQTNLIYAATTYIMTDNGYSLESSYIFEGI